MVEHDSKPIRRFRAGGYGAMVEDDNGIYVRFDEMQEYVAALVAKLLKSAPSFMAERAK